MPETWVYDDYTYYGAGTVIAAGGGGHLTFQTPPADSYVGELPAGWAFTEFGLSVPAGVYGVTWYWDCSKGGSTPWDNYISTGPVTPIYGPDLYAGSIHPTAPKATPNGTWGSASAVVSLLADSDPPDPVITFVIANLDTVPRTILNLVQITRLDVGRTIAGVVTPASVAAWGKFDLPAGDELALLELLIAGAVEQLSELYYLADPLTAVQEIAVTMQVARWWARRDTPEGRAAFGGDIAVQITSLDPDVTAMLRPRQGLA